MNSLQKIKIKNKGAGDYKQPNRKMKKLKSPVI